MCQSEIVYTECLHLGHICVGDSLIDNNKEKSQRVETDFEGYANMYKNNSKDKGVDNLDYELAINFYVFV